MSYIDQQKRLKVKLQLQGSRGNVAQQSGVVKIQFADDNTDEHKRMIRQDYEAVLYRKLNYIIQLEQNEEIFNNNQKLMSNNQNKISSYDQKYSDFLHQDVQQENPLVLYSRQLVNYHSKLIKQSYHKKINAQLQVQIDRLSLDKRTLIQEAKVFLEKLSQITSEMISSQQCLQVQNALIERSKKYSEYNTVTKFITQVKQIFKHNIVKDNLKAHLQPIISQTPLSQLSEQFKPFYLKQKSLKQPIEHITLYLKQFRSIAIYKQLIEAINKLIIRYQKINPLINPLYRKIIEQIRLNFNQLHKIQRQISDERNRSNDNRIDLQILIEENKNILKNIEFWQGKVRKYTQQESYKLTLQYFQNHNNSSRNGGDYSDRQYEAERKGFNQLHQYFYNKLNEQYQHFITQQQAKSQKIELIKQKIHHQNTLQTQLLKTMSKYYPKSHNNSQLPTHRSINQSTHTGKNGEVPNHCLNEQSKSYNNSQAFLSLNSSKSHLNLHDKNDEGMKKFNNLISQIEKKQKFIVKKFFNIGKFNLISKQNQHKQLFKQQSKSYQLNLTKKYLILHPITHTTLIFNQKIQITKIKAYKMSKQPHCLVISYGNSNLKLNFMNKNLNIFVQLLDKIVKNKTKQ